MPTTDQQVTAGIIFSNADAINEVYESFTSYITKDNVTPHAQITIRNGRRPYGTVKIGAEKEFPVFSDDGKRIELRKFKDMSIYDRNLITFHEMLHILITYHPSYLLFQQQYEQTLDEKGYGSPHLFNVLSDFVIDTLSKKAMYDLNATVYFKDTLRKFHYATFAVKDWNKRIVSISNLSRPIYREASPIKIKKLVNKLNRIVGTKLFAVNPLSIVYLTAFQYLYTGKDNKYISDSDAYLRDFFNYLDDLGKNQIISRNNIASIKAYFNALKIFKQRIEDIANSKYSLLTRETFDWKDKSRVATYNDNFNNLLKVLKEFDRRLQIIPPLVVENNKQVQPQNSQNLKRQGQNQCRGGVGVSDQKQRSSGGGSSQGSRGKQGNKQQEQQQGSGQGKDKEQQGEENKENDQPVDAETKAKEVSDNVGHDKKEVTVSQGDKEEGNEPIEDPEDIADAIKGAIQENAPLSKEHLKDKTDRISIGKGERGGSIIYQPIPQNIKNEAKALVKNKLHSIATNQYIYRSLMSLMRLGVMMHVNENSPTGSEINIPQVINHMPDIMSGRTDVPVFKQYRTRRVKKLRILMIYDVSGSMEEVNQWLKFATNYLLNSILGQLFDVTIVDFSNSYRIEKNKNPNYCGIYIDNEGGTMPFEDSNIPTLEGILRHTQFDMAVFVSDYGFDIGDKVGNRIGTGRVSDCYEHPKRCAKNIVKIIHKLSHNANVPVLPVQVKDNEKEVLNAITKVIIRTALQMNGLLQDQDISI